MRRHCVWFRKEVTVSSAVRIVKLGAHIGARVEGMQLSDDLSDATVATVNDALLEHKVVFFRGQHDLDDDG